MSIHKITRLENLDATEARYLQEMFVSAYDYPAFAGKGTGKKFVVVRIIAEWRRQPLRGENLSLEGDQFDDGLQVNPGKFAGKGFSNSLVFIENFLGNGQLQSAVPPGFKDLVGRS